LKLDQLLEGLSYKCLNGSIEAEIHDMDTDSRSIGPGGLFIALKGSTSDGHDYLEQARARGAAGALVEHQVPGILPDVGFTVVEVEHLSAQIAVIASRFYGQPSHHMSLIGITGTNGKTSVAQMLADAFESLEETVSVFGTIGNRIGHLLFETANTTMEPVALQRMFKKALDAGTTRLIMEVSSHGLDLGRVDHTRFSGAVFTNLTEDHLDFHPDMEAYFKAKVKLFEINEGSAVVNLDDPYGERLISMLRDAHKPVITYGLSETCDIRATDLLWKPGYTTYKLKTSDYEVEVAVPGLGRIQVYNSLAVFAVLVSLGYGQEEVLHASGALKSVPGRMERIQGDWPFDIFVDFAHTPDALRNVLEISRELTQSQLKVLFGCGGDRDRKKRPVMGKLAAMLADVIYLTSDNPRTEDPQRILEEILHGIPKAASAKVKVIPDRKNAIRTAIQSLKQGDVLLLAGKGHEPYQIIGHEKHHFDDREEALKAIEALLNYKKGNTEA
jgi:UDP-N-acetylmuramoyl-L-alanyl-D-glutamate--2,6-diaminopimelate ligase